MAVDPDMGNFFWAANEYKAAGVTSLWGTRLASFEVSKAPITIRPAHISGTGLTAAPPANQPPAPATPVAGQAAAHASPSPEGMREDVVVATPLETKPVGDWVSRRTPEPLAIDGWSGVVDPGERWWSDSL
jgi:hypothetical protein